MKNVSEYKNLQTSTGKLKETSARSETCMDVGDKTTTNSKDGRFPMLYKNKTNNIEKKHDPS